jgi:hypothetical protein
MSYDPKCYELAEHFLPSQASQRLKSELAQAIQDAVEDYSVGESVNLTVALSKGASHIYAGAGCVFNYCPHPEICKQEPTGCIQTRPCEHVWVPAALGEVCEKCHIHSSSNRA